MSKLESESQTERSQLVHEVTGKILNSAALRLQEVDMRWNELDSLVPFCARYTSLSTLPTESLCSFRMTAECGTGRNARRNSATYSLL